MAVEDVSAQPSHLEHGERAGQRGQRAGRRSGDTAGAVGAVVAAAKEDNGAARSTTSTASATTDDPAELVSDHVAASGADAEQADDVATAAKSQELFSSQHQRGVYLMGQLLSVGIALTTGMVVVVV